MRKYLPFILIGGVLLAVIGVVAYQLNQPEPNANNVFANPTSKPQPAPTNQTASTTPPKILPAHSHGNPNAPVTLEEFGDFQCPPCGMLHPVIADLEKEYGDRIQFKFSHFPIAAAHPYAEFAAQAAEAAGMQNKFWEMHHKIYDNQKTWHDAKTPDEAKNIFIGYAGELKLDVEKFKRDIDSPEARAQIISDRIRAQALGVGGTPTLFLSNRNRTPQMLRPELMTVKGIHQAINYLLQEIGVAPPQSALDTANGKDESATTPPAPTKPLAAKP